MKKNIKVVDDIKKLEKLISKGLELGIDLSEIKEKFESVKDSLNEEIIRIVLLGSFSDGKTTTMAAMMGKLEDSMKIDSDESSDELKIYRPDGLKKGFEFVDTPGLFGTKEKEVDGKNVKFSDITKKYLSEAHIVLYVCDAVVPLKDSHAPIIKWIMRDLNKLDNTIFVINKMDETGYDITDPEEYDKVSNIKKDNLVSRLSDVIDLTEDEKERLHIICIAANPKGKGLEHWFAKMDNYKSRSHIDLLNNEVNKITNSSELNKNELILSSAISSINDMVINVQDEIEKTDKPLGEMVKKISDSCSDLKTELNLLKTGIDSAKVDCYRQLKTYHDTILTEISSISLETFESVLQNSLGIQNGEVTFYVLNSEIGNILQNSSNIVSTSIEKSDKIFSAELDKQNSVISDVLNKISKEGIDFLKNTKISSDHVKKGRDIFFKSYKFKRGRVGGAQKLAGKLNKAVGYVAVALEAAMLWKEYSEKKKLDKELEENKINLKNSISDIFADVFKLFDGDNFYSAYAPEYNDMVKELNGRIEELELVNLKKAELDGFNHQVKLYLENVKTSK